MTGSFPASQAARGCVWAARCSAAFPDLGLRGRKAQRCSTLVAFQNSCYGEKKRKKETKRPMINHPYAVPRATAIRTHASPARPSLRRAMPKEPGTPVSWGRKATEPAPGTEMGGRAGEGGCSGRAPHHLTASRGGDVPWQRTDIPGPHRRERRFLQSNPPATLLPEAAGSWRGVLQPGTPKLPELGVGKHRGCSSAGHRAERDSRVLPSSHRHHAAPRRG